MDNISISFFIVLMLGLLIVLGVPLMMLIKILNSLLRRFEQFENDLKRFTRKQEKQQ